MEYVLSVMEKNHKICICYYIASLICFGNNQFKEIPMDIVSKLASRTKQMGVNAIREILKVVSQPGMISLAGGIPSPESFPLDLMGRLYRAVLDRHPANRLVFLTADGKTNHRIFPVFSMHPAHRCNL